MLLRRALLLAALLVAQAGASTKDLMGYMEGSRRTVSCKGGGFFNGIEASFNTYSDFKEKVVLGLRLRCSTGMMELQYSGEVPDSHTFGANFDSGTVLTAACPPGKGIAGLRWRRGEKSGSEEQAWKPGGLQVYCGSETVNPLRVDLSPGQSYPMADTRCSATAAPPPSTAERHASELEVWQEVDWVGLRILKCGADGGAPGPAPA